MPNGAKWIPMSEILTYEEIERICREAVRIGITRFKITGGEPLVRKGCADLIRMIRQIPGTEEVTMTTMGFFWVRIWKIFLQRAGCGEYQSGYTDSGKISGDYRGR